MKLQPSSHIPPQHEQRFPLLPLQIGTVRRACALETLWVVTRRWLDIRRFHACAFRVPGYVPYALWLRLVIRLWPQRGCAEKFLLVVSSALAFPPAPHPSALRCCPFPLRAYHPSASDPASTTLRHPSPPVAPLFPTRASAAESDLIRWSARLPSPAHSFRRSPLTFLLAQTSSKQP